MLKEEFGFKRFGDNPIIKPSDFPGAMAIYNCGQTMYQGKTILLVAIRLRNKSVPEMHVAESVDGIHFTIRPEAFIKQSNLETVAPFDNWPIDPRITYMEEEGVYYIMRPGNSDAGCVAILGKTTDWETYEDIDIIALPDNRVPCLFPKKIGGYYVRLDRPYVLVGDPHNVNQHGYIWLSYSPDLLHWGRHRLLLKPWSHWNGVKIGPTVPIYTKDGWLEIIHGVSGSCSGACYSLGAILLDLEDPTKIIGKCESYLLTPDAPYEITGIVPNVVFACGAIPDYQEDRIRLYYGAADTCIGLATASISELVQLCKDGQ